MFEPLLLANPDIDTLRHQCSRASTLAKEPARPHVFCMLRFFGVSGLVYAVCFVSYGASCSLPHFLVGSRCGPSCVQIWRVVVRG